jgi:hypothetical protein
LKVFQFPWILEILRRASCLLLRHPYHPWIVSSWCFLQMRVARLFYQTKLPSATAATTRTTRKVSSLRASLAARKRNSRENSEMPPQVRKERPRVMQWDAVRKGTDWEASGNAVYIGIVWKPLCFLLVPMFSAFPRVAEKKTFRKEDAPP